MELYHVSCNKYEIGKKFHVSEFEQTQYYTNAIATNQSWIDDFLDSIKPAGAPERKRTFYAFDSLGNCFAFLKGKCPDGLNFYKVNMIDPIACPMCLTDALKRNEDELNMEIGKEYWHPVNSWRFLEYLSESMEIIDVLPKPDFMEIATGGNNYDMDYNLKNKLFNLK